MRVEILGQERRRRWRDEQKLEIVLSVGQMPGLAELGVPNRKERSVEIVHRCSAGGALLIGADP